jgi:hypothetical protein
MSNESLLEKVVNAHRYFSKFTPEQQEILEKLIEFTDDGGFNILGDVKGDVNGDISGDIYGAVYGNVESDVKGDVNGDVLGCVKGSVGSYIGGNVWGNISGWCGGGIDKDVEGDVGGSVCGNIKGSVHGNVEGSIKGNVLGDVMGEINVLGGDYNRRLVEMELAIKHLIESKDALNAEINGMDGLEERVHSAECSIRTLEDDSKDMQWDIWDIKETIEVR